MTELTNDKQFRFVPQIGTVVESILPLLSPKDRELMLREIEPALVHRDWQVEDAITRALGCCGQSVNPTPGTILTSDSFAAGGTRPNNTLSVTDTLFGGGTPEPWSALSGDWGLDGAGAATLNAGVAGVFSVAIVDCDATDATVQAVVFATGGVNVAGGVVARVTGVGDFYAYYLFRDGSGNFMTYLTKHVAGVQSTIAGPNAKVLIPGNTASLSLTVQGSSLTTLYGGSPDFAVQTDTAHPTGDWQGITQVKASVTNLDSFRVTAA